MLFHVLTVMTPPTCTSFSHIYAVSLINIVVCSHALFLMSQSYRLPHALLHACSCAFFLINKLLHTFMHSLMITCIRSDTLSHAHLNHSRYWTLLQHLHSHAFSHTCSNAFSKVYSHIHSCMHASKHTLSSEHCCALLHALSHAHSQACCHALWNACSCELLLFHVLSSTGFSAIIISASHTLVHVFVCTPSHEHTHIQYTFSCTLPCVLACNCA